MSEKLFTTLTAVALPLLRDNINTDVIIPSREMKWVSRKGLADGLFADWRYLTVGGRDLNPSFPLNDPRYRGSAILLTGDNFGCGSSREHAAWALAEYGFRAILASGFNPIFRGNAILNGIVPVTLPRAQIQTMSEMVAPDPAGNRITVDLEAMRVVAPGGPAIGFELDGESRQMLLEGLDLIDLTLKHRQQIAAFRASDSGVRPWAYASANADSSQ